MQSLRRLFDNEGIKMFHFSLTWNFQRRCLKFPSDENEFNEVDQTKIYQLNIKKNI